MGGACFICDTAGTPSFEGCTFYGNAAPQGSGIFTNALHDSTVTIENTIIAFGSVGEAIAGWARPVIRCCDLYGNEGGDWVMAVEGLADVEGNICEDPLFCDSDNGDFSLHRDSPCLPDHDPVCGLIGAWPVGCDPAGVLADEALPARIRVWSMPNPFTSTATIHYSVRQSGHVTLRIYDVSGGLVRSLLDEPVDLGRVDYFVVWDGTDDAGIPVATGEYFIRLRSGSKEVSGKLIYMR
jgi:hypothetical protein